MGLRGCFIRGDGLIIPNNVTEYGCKLFLELAFQDSSYNVYIALANAVPDFGLQLEELNEPTLGVNGYARQAIARDNIDWPTIALELGEPYIESKNFVFAATGGPYDKAINRLALVNHQTSVLGAEVIALSAAMPAELTIDVGTPELSRTFKYRLYLR